jgi:hypothetical protein
MHCSALSNGHGRRGTREWEGEGRQKSIRVSSPGNHPWQVDLADVDLGPNATRQTGMTSAAAAAPGRGAGVPRWDKVILRGPQV